MSAPVSFLSAPADIVNEAIDVLGQSGQIIGDIVDGTVVAEAARRYYGQALRQLLRTAWWDFARKRTSLVLLGDATGQSAPPVSSLVECPWTYAYEWPIDAVAARWLPWNPTNAQPVNQSGVPLTTGVSALSQYPAIPGVFLVSSSELYPIETGSPGSWDQLPDLQRTFGVGPTSRKVILTNCASAELVYTKFVPVIEEWDSLFRQAMVTMMALALAPTAILDPKIRIAERDRLGPVLKNAVADARVASGNEAGFPQTTEHQPTWITARNAWNWLGYTYPGYGGTAAGGGYSFYPYDASFSWCGSVY